MEFIWLATGHETFPLLKAICSTGEYRLAGFTAPDSLAADILSLMPTAKRLASPAEALNVARLDAAIIDADDADTLEIAKQLAANSVALLLVPQAAHGIEFIYQLGLIRDEQPDKFRLYPIRPWRVHPLVLRLKEDLQNNRLGKIHQVQFERHLNVAVTESRPALLTKPQVEAALLADADLLKFVTAEFDQVTSLQTGSNNEEIVQASVTMAGVAGNSAQWICRGTEQSEGWTLTVTGAGGNVVLSGRDGWQTITRKSSLQGEVNQEEVTYDYGPAVLNEFLGGYTAEAATNWANDLNRTFDLLEGVNRSLRRRRTVELYFDTPSERSNFKTQMTAIGCSVLMLTLLTIIIGLGAGIVATELKLPDQFMQVVRVLVFAPLFLFLILQVGILLAKPSAR